MSFPLNAKCDQVQEEIDSFKDFRFSLERINQENSNKTFSGDDILWYFFLFTELLVIPLRYVYTAFDCCFKTNAA